jgi:hypothetical protein
MDVNIAVFHLRIPPGGITDCDSLLKAVNFLSLDDYRQTVGEQRLLFETELVTA